MFDFIKRFWSKKDDQVLPMEFKSSHLLQFMHGTQGNVIAFNRYSVTEIIEHFQSVAPLNTAVMKIANAVGSLPCKIVDKRTGKVQEGLHPFLELLNHPNDELQQTKKDFLRDATIWKLLEGDTYIQADGKFNKPPIRLSILHPSCMIPIAGPTGFVEQFQYSSVGGVSIDFQKDPRTNKFLTKNKMQELIHLANFNAEQCRGALTGDPEVLPLFYEVNNYLLSSMHNVALLRNGARPSGAFILKKDSSDNPAVLSKEEFKRLRKQVDSFSGPGSAGRPYILEGGMSWQSLSENAKDMDFASLKDRSEQQIYKNLGVPIQLIMDVGATFNSMAASRLGFYEDTVLPMADDLFDFLSTKLLSRYPGGDNLKLVIDREKVDALALKRAEFVKSVEERRTLTLNEKRELLGSGPLPDGDVIVNMSGTIINIGSDAPSDDTQDNVAPNNNVDANAGKNLRIEKKDFEPEDLGAIIGAIGSPTVFSDIAPLINEVFTDVIEEFGAEFVTEIGVISLFELNDRVTTFVRAHTGEFITQINEATLNRLKQVVVEAIEGDFTGPEIIAAVEGVFDSRRSDASLKRISQTETTRLAGFSSNESMAQSGIEKKEWLAVKDGKTRDTHEELDGQVQDVTQPFINTDGATAQSPGGFGIADQDIECRCVSAPVFETKELVLRSDDERKTLWLKREQFRMTAEQQIESMARSVFTIQLTKIIQLLNR